MYTEVLLGKHCYQSFDVTAELSSLILLSSKLHIFLSSFGQ